MKRKAVFRLNRLIVRRTCKDHSVDCGGSERPRALTVVGLEARKIMALLSRRHIGASLVCFQATKNMLKINFITLTKCTPTPSLWQHNALESISALRPPNSSYSDVFPSDRVPTIFNGAVKHVFFNSSSLWRCALNDCLYVLSVSRGVQLRCCVKKE